MNAQPPPPPPPPPSQEPGALPPQPPAAAGSPGGGPGGEEKAGTGLRILAGLGFVVLLFVTAVMAIVFAQIGGTDTCESVATGDGVLNSDGECYDGSSTVKAIALILGWPGTIALGIATVLSLVFAIRGRSGRPLLYALGAGVVLIALSLIIG